jgi:hypothetical protein
MTEMVWAASKIEMSLDLRLQRKTTTVMRNGPHTWNEDCWEFFGQSHTLRGNAIARGQFPNGYVPPLIVNDAALSQIPRDFFEAWLVQNAEHPAVKAGLIFMHQDQQHVADEAREKIKMKSGFEPMVPNEHNAAGEITVNDTRWPKRVPASQLGVGAPQ